MGTRKSSILAKARFQDICALNPFEFIEKFEYFGLEVYTFFEKVFRVIKVCQNAMLNQKSIATSSLLSDLLINPAINLSPVAGIRLIWQAEHVHSDYPLRDLPGNCELEPHINSRIHLGIAIAINRRANLQLYCEPLINSAMHLLLHWQTMPPWIGKTQQLGSIACSICPTHCLTN